MGIAIAAIFALLLVIFVVLPLAGLALWFIVSTAFFGLVIGGLARLIVPGRQKIGILPTIALGILGSLVGGVIGHLIGVGHIATFLLEIGVATAGVAVMSHNGRALGGRRPRTPLGY